MRISKFLAGAVAAALCCAGAADAQVVISQVYGGGGNNGATYQNDFVELHNTGSSPVNITGWSVQYASATDSQGGFGSGNPATNVPVVLTGTLQAGQFYLVQLAAGGAVGALLPTADASGAINMNQNGARVALVSNGVALGALGANCTAASILDLVGYGGPSGTAICWEGSGRAPNLNSSTAAIRGNSGCLDNNDNATDFTGATPSPRNSASPVVSCQGTPPTGSGTANPFVPCNGDNVELLVSVTPGNPPPNGGITVTGNLSLIGGSNSQPFADLGGGTFSFTQTVSPTTSAGSKLLPIAVSDAQGRSSQFTIEVIVDRCTPTSSGLIEPLALCTSGGMARVVVFINPATTLNPVFAAGSLTTDISLLGGSPTQQLYDDATNGDRVANDNIWSFEFPVGAYPVGMRTITWTGSDLSGRPTTGMAAVQFIDCTASAPSVVISQVYGGGGNTGAQLTNDFIEIFNRSQSPVDITGWSVQYAATAGAFSNKTDLPPVLLQPGQYLLVQEGAGNACGGLPCGVAPPTADVVGTIAMSGTSAKVALVSSTVLIGSNCADASVVDLVSYGTGVTCQEGLFGAPGLGNSVANFRLQNGCQDTNQNAPDLFPAAPAPRNTSSPFNVCAGGPVTGACCLLDGTCAVQTIEDCGTAAGLFIGGACGQADCGSQFVACCINDTCSSIAVGGCLFQGGTPAHFGTCNSEDCVPAFCDADWCQDGSVGVPDIFCFLSDWFAFVPAARNYGGTPGVPAIFAFLSIWFATGQGPCTP